MNNKNITRISVLLLMLVLVEPAFSMTNAQKESCHIYIHSAAVAAAGSAAVLSQAPGSDNIPLALIIGGLTIKIADIFGYSFSDVSDKVLGVMVLNDFAGTLLTRYVSQWLIGWIPFLGNYSNAATAAGVVEFIGWQVAYAFDENNWTKFGIGSIANFLYRMKK